MSLDLNPDSELVSAQSEPEVSVPDFMSDCDPGDESSPSLTVEAHARSGTRANPSQFPAGF